MDEADRMFDLGFIKDIRFLLRRMPIRTERQTLLFSATLSHRVLELAYEHMNEPEKLIVETDTITNSKVRQLVYFPADEEKIPLLIGLLTRSEGQRTMIFVNTKVWVERVAKALERAGFRVGVLSGDVPQKKRETLLGRFQKGQLDLLVATDVAARGLHIDGVSHVYNYDLPFDAEDYVHRIGRTARLGAEGDAISFACERYAMSLPDIETFIEQKLPTAPVEPELLIAVPRAPRPASMQGDDDESGESVSAIFREAREAKAAEDERRGGGRSSGRQSPGRQSSGGRSGGGGSSAPRSSSGGRSGESRGGGPRRERSKPSEATSESAAAAETQPAASVEKVAPSGEFATPPASTRKPRRRRGGRGRGKVQGDAAGTPENATANPQAAKKSTPAATEAPGLLSRIKSKLRSLVKRPPSGHH
jgi:ATP-dependent RNA helicase RhlB